MDPHFSQSFRDFTVSIVNEHSLGLYFIQQHVKETLPLQEEVREELAAVNAKVEASVKDAEQTAHELDRINQLAERWSPYMFYLLEKTHSNLSLKGVK